MSATSVPLFAVLPERSLIRLQGQDWRSFLQGLVTQDVLSMAEGEVRYAVLLTPQGRLLHDMFITAEGDGAWLDVAAATSGTLLGRLKLYRLRAKVEISAAAGRVVALFGPAPEGRSTGWRPDPRLPSLGFRGVDLPPPSAAKTVDAEAYDGHRLAQGVGDLGRDRLGDRVYALEANLDLLHGVDFHKGCFVGQETTSRMKRRGGVRSRLVPIRYEGDAPTPGAEVVAGDLRAGEVLSGVDGLALALVRLDRAAGSALTVEGRPARLAPPPWLAHALATSPEQMTAPPV